MQRNKCGPEWAVMRQAGIAERFAYNQSNGKLFYDGDGNGSGGVRLLVATFRNAPTLAASDLFYVT